MLTTTSQVHLPSQSDFLFFVGSGVWLTFYIFLQHPLVRPLSASVAFLTGPSTFILIRLVDDWQRLNDNVMQLYAFFLFALMSIFVHLFGAHRRIHSPTLSVQRSHSIPHDTSRHTYDLCSTKVWHRGVRPWQKPNNASASRPLSGRKPGAAGGCTIGRYELGNQLVGSLE